MRAALDAAASAGAPVLRLAPPKCEEDAPFGAWRTWWVEQLVTNHVSALPPHLRQAAPLLAELLLPSAEAARSLVAAAAAAAPPSFGSDELPSPPPLPSGAGADAARAEMVAHLLRAGGLGRAIVAADDAAGCDVLSLRLLAAVASTLPGLAVVLTSGIGELDAPPAGATPTDEAAARASTPSEVVAALEATRRPYPHAAAARRRSAAEPRRRGHVVRIRLGGLDAAAAASLAAQKLGVSPTVLPPDLGARLLALAGDHPLFLAETVASLMRAKLILVQPASQAASTSPQAASPLQPASPAAAAAVWVAPNLEAAAASSFPTGLHQPLHNPWGVKRAGSAPATAAPAPSAHPPRRIASAGAAALSSDEAEAEAEAAASSSAGCARLSLLVQRRADGLSAAARRGLKAAAVLAPAPFDARLLARTAGEPRSAWEELQRRPQAAAAQAVAAHDSGRASPDTVSPGLSPAAAVADELVAAGFLVRLSSSPPDDGGASAPPASAPTAARTSGSSASSRAAPPADATCPGPSPQHPPPPQPRTSASHPPPPPPPPPSPPPLPLFAFAHSAVRSVVAASTPADQRGALHARALDAALGGGGGARGAGRLDPPPAMSWGEKARHARGAGQLVLATSCYLASAKGTATFRMAEALRDAREGLASLRAAGVERFGSAGNLTAAAGSGGGSGGGGGGSGDDGAPLSPKPPVAAASPRTSAGAAAPAGADDAAGALEALDVAGSDDEWHAAVSSRHTFAGSPPPRARPGRRVARASTSAADAQPPAVESRRLRAELHDVLAKVSSVQASWALLQPMLEPVAAAALENFLHRRPDAARLFSASPEARAAHGLVLLNYIGGCVGGLVDFAALLPVLHAAGRAHVKLHDVYPIKEGMPDLGAALLDALAAGLGDRFTPAVASVWAETYDVLAFHVTAGMRQGVEEEARKQGAASATSSPTDGQACEATRIVYKPGGAAEGGAAVAAADAGLSAGLLYGWEVCGGGAPRVAV